MKPRTKSVMWNIKKQKSPNQTSKKRIESEDSIRSLWDNFKHMNICIMGVLQGDERDQKIGNLFEKIMTENFPNLVKEIGIQVQEAQRVSNKVNPKKPTPKHIIIKMTKVKYKERILKATREKQLVTLQGSSHKTVS